MAKKVHIDIVSDVVCSWCAIGLHGLDTALDALKGQVDADITLYPFQLNPDLPREGQVHLDYITSRMGVTQTQARQMRAQIRERAAAVGFEVNRDDTTRIYNTFDAHRLLTWAREFGKQKQLSEAFMFAYFTELKNLADQDVLVAATEKAGLDGVDALIVLNSDRYADEVRKEESHWRARGVRTVPTMVINGRTSLLAGYPPKTSKIDSALF